MNGAGQFLDIKSQIKSPKKVTFRYLQEAIWSRATDNNVFERLGSDSTQAVVKPLSSTTL